MLREGMNYVAWMQKPEEGRREFKISSIIAI
jgi:hypothetical protein